MRSIRTIRWWPLVAVWAAATGTWIWNTARPGVSGQGRAMMAMGVGVLAVLASLLWLALLSRAPGRARWIGLAAAVTAILGLAATVRIGGVTGDLVPILEWRWARNGAAGAAAVPGRNELRGDFGQFLGPNRDGRAATAALADWDAAPPEELWRRPVGAGWSGFSIAGRLAVTQMQEGDDELVVAYDLGSGRQVWRHADAARYETTIGGVGPRATPTIAGDRVVTSGATGLLNVLDLATGELIWSRHPPRELGSVDPEWGRPASPLVVGDLVVAAVGADGPSLAAYRLADGAPVWTGGRDFVGYSSPVVGALGGRRQVVLLTRGMVAGHDLETGALLWSHPWPSDQPNVAAPLLLPEDRVLVSSGYGVGSSLLRIQPQAGGALAVVEVWHSPRLKAKFTNPVHRDGFVYGLDDGVLTCLDLANGERRWKRGRYGHGQVLLAGDLLLVTGETGQVVLVEARPDEFVERATFQAFTGKSWNPAALTGDLLLWRTHEEAALFRLPVR